MRDGMVIVESFINMAEAELAQAQLQAMGLMAEISADNCGGMRPHMDLTGGVHLLVEESRATEAADLLKGRAEAATGLPWDCPGCGERIEAGQQPGAHAHRVDVPGGDSHRSSPVPGEAAAGAASSGAR